MANEFPVASCHWGNLLNGLLNDFFFLWLGFIRYVFCALKTQHGQFWIHNCQIYYSFIFTILTRNSFCFILFFFLSVSSPRIIYALLHLEYWVFMLSFARFYVWFLVNHFRSYDRTTTKKLTISHTKEAEKGEQNNIGSDNNNKFHFEQ